MIPLSLHNSSTKLCIAYLLLLFTHISSFSAHPRIALVTESPHKPRTAFVTSLRATASATTEYYTACLDGGEWQSFIYRLESERDRTKENLKASQESPKQLPSSSPVGSLTLVAGSLPEDSRRILAMPVPENALKSPEMTTKWPITTMADESDTKVFTDSIVYLPKSISTEQAVQTYLHGTISVHLALPLTTHVGGAEDGVMLASGPDTTVCVVGLSASAMQAAKALGVLGVNVTLVGNSGERPGKLDKRVKYLPVSVEVEREEDDIDDDYDEDWYAEDDVDEDEGYIPFSKAMGKIDSLVDVVGNEWPTLDEHSSGFRPKGGQPRESLLLRGLAQQHQCHTYVSTLSAAQEVVNTGGVMQGPKKADEKKKLALAALDATRAQEPLVFPPAYLASTLQTLFDAGFIWQDSDRKVVKQNKNRRILYRSWALPQVWEYVRWPRDTESANVRYGFPVPDEWVSSDDIVEERMLSAPPGRFDSPISDSASSPSKDSSVVDEKPTTDSQDIFAIDGVRGLNHRIIGQELDCVLFLSATFCRTCRYLQPKYQRMARLNNEDKESSLVFGQASATGVDGKLLGRALGVDSVPAFVVFRKGRVFGKPLSISKLPDPRLNLAIEYLKNDQEWDEEAFRKANRRQANK